MSAKRSLQISSRKFTARLTPDQERFRFLIAQIEKLRKTREQWDAGVQAFRLNRAQRLEPLRTTLRTLSRDTVFALDRLLDQPGFSRPECAALRSMLRGTAEVLLEAKSDDTAIKELFDKHADVDFDSAKQEELRRLKAEAEESMGVDLGDDEIHSEEDLVDRVYEEMAAREARDKRRTSAASQRIEDNAQLARRSLREIYRKLASAVHPDREPDAELRAEKNALMQRINQAYAANDLLTLIEVQMQIEQIDADHIRKLGAQQLKHYNRLLAEQLNHLKTTIKDLQMGLCTDYGLEPKDNLNPQMLSHLLNPHIRGLRAEITRQREFLGVLATKAATKRWLKQQRRFARLSDDDGDAE
jgi:hypothetical protein